MKFVFILCSLCFFGATYASNALDSLRAEQRKEGLFIIHQVDEEETIYSIAKRYGGSVDGIIQHNHITDNRIEIGQIIQVLVEKEKEKPENVDDLPKPLTEGFHLVAHGETLYSISRKYGVKLRELKKWNELESNDLAPGMTLQVKEEVEIDLSEENNQSSMKSIEKDSSQVDTVSVDSFEDFEKYFVQTGETLYTIASKTGVSVDSLKFWNELQSDYLKIGQQLYYKGVEVDSVITEPKRNRIEIDENGFERVYEIGITSVIQSIDTKKFLALHRTLPIGTKLEVRNLMNNQVVHVKIVGKLPNTGLNKDLLLRLSQPAYDQLGILDPKSRVEVSYYKK